MKRFAIVVLGLFQFSNSFSQGITLLYTDTGWVQIDTLPGQIPERRPPTSIDDVVISKTRSGVTGTGLTVHQGDTVGIGGGASSFCRRLYLYGLDVSFLEDDVDQSGAQVHVHTSTGGGLVLDSGSVLHSGQFTLYGEDPGVIGLEVRDSKFGQETQHNRVFAELFFEDGGRAYFKRSSFAGFYFASAQRVDGTYATGVGLYADSSTFNAGRFILGDNSVDTFTNCSIRPNGINDGGVNFFIGKNSAFVSSNDTIYAFNGELNFTTSGSVYRGDVQGWYCRFLQEDAAHPLPNIIDGNVIITEDPGAGISGDLKISGDLTSYFPGDAYTDTPAVFVNGTKAFAIAGIGNFGTDLLIDNCVQNFCHYKLEFFGNTNSNISWNIGFPVDTLVINKSGCAKVTCNNSIYVAGATQIENGQLVLEPDAALPYKFACAGNVHIAQGAGLFLKKNANGDVANIAVAGTINDENSVPDSICSGLSNPYGATIANYPQVLPLTLTDFSGIYQSNAVALAWRTENELNTKYFVLEKSYDLLTFTPLTTFPAGGNSQQARSYRYLDKGFLKDLNYYRLKVVDVDGRISYSKTVAVLRPNIADVSLFPNPVKDKFMVRIPNARGPVSAIIVDGNGATIKRVIFSGWNGQLTIHTIGLPTGVYSLMLRSDTFSQTLRFVKQ